MNRERQVLLVVQHVAHHGQASGYQRLAEFLVAEGSASVIAHGFPRRGTWRLAQPFARRAGLAWYGAEAFLTEVWAAGVAAYRNGLLHFLQGESSYRYAARIPGGRRRRLVATFHLPPSVFRDHVGPTRHLERLDALILVARNQLDLLNWLTRRPACHVVAHGVDVDFFRPGPAPVREEHCLFVGQWLRDFSTLRAVVEGVRRKAPRVRFTLVIPAHLAAAWQGQPGVEVRSELDDASLLRCYQQATLLLMPLRDCTANNALLEGMACGLPIVATDVGGIRDYVSEDCARLVPPHDPAAMAEAVLELVQESGVREALARAARARAETFAWPRIAKQVLDVYASLR